MGGTGWFFGSWWVGRVGIDEIEVAGVDRRGTIGGREVGVG